MNVSNAPNQFSTLILAGGKSSRMGQDKAELVIDGVSLLNFMQQLAKQAGSSQIIISRNRLKNQQDYVHDLQPDQGPIAGILAALPHCKAKTLLVLPIDTPLLNPAKLQQLVQLAGTGAAYFTHSPLPCVLPNSPAVAKLITRQMQQGQNSIFALLAALNAKQLNTSADELINTNTPADWQYCLTELANRSLYAKA